MSKLNKWFQELPVSKKIQFFAALIITFGQILAIGIYAWFSYHQGLNSMTKVKAPPTLNLASGHLDEISYFELQDIDVTKGKNSEEKDEKYKDYVFSVEPGKIAKYNIQIAHTTNIPFKYELYRAKEDVNGDIVYRTSEDEEITYSIITEEQIEGIDQKINLKDYNPDNRSTGRTLGLEDKLPAGRKNYDDGDTVNIYAAPLYSIARNISRNDAVIDKSAERDYFVLRLVWKYKDSLSDSEKWNYAVNNKETDIVYISAQESSE